MRKGDIVVVSAAVKIYEERLQKEIIMPCHRHCDAFWILKEFGYQPAKGYKVLDDGFLDEHWNFMNRIEAHKMAYDAGQIPNDKPYHPTELFSEDLW